MGPSSKAKRRTGRSSMYRYGQIVVNSGQGYYLLFWYVVELCIHFFFSTRRFFSQLTTTTTHLSLLILNAGVRTWSHSTCYCSPFISCPDDSSMLTLNQECSCSGCTNTGSGIGSMIENVRPMTHRWLIDDSTSFFVNSRRGVGASYQCPLGIGSKLPLLPDADVHTF